MQRGKVDRAVLAAYWSENKRLTTVTLIVWAAVSFGAILLAEGLNTVIILGFPLGYYLGAQGALIVFVLLVFNYSRAMNNIDRKHSLHEEER